VDPSGSFLIFTTGGGSIGWQKFGSRPGEVLTANDGYVVADW
jgi:hypothetical protein